MDVFDTGKEFLLEFEIPGVKRDDVEVTANGQGVLLVARQRPEARDAPRVYAERGPVTYRRFVPVPAEVQTGHVKATYQDGILTVTLPRRNPEEGSRRVDVA